MTSASEESEQRVGIERRMAGAARFINRRMGFDRRDSYPVLGAIRDRPWILVIVLVLLNALSVLDGWFTAGEIGLGIATEGNPLLGAIAERDPMLAVGFKLGVILLVSVGIWLGRKRRAILAVALAALVLFAGVVLYHYSALKALGYI